MRKCLFLLVTLWATPLLRAQRVEVYGTVNGIHANNVPTQSGQSSYVCGPLSCISYDPEINESRVGAGGGVTLNFLRLRRATLGFDARFSRRFGNEGANSVFGGLKLTFVPPLLKIRPYIQGSGGYLGVAAPTGNPTSLYYPVQTTLYSDYGAVELLAGLDVPLTRLLDLRVIEIGGGHALNLNYYSKPTFVTASAGIVVHFQSLLHKINVP